MAFFKSIISRDNGTPWGETGLTSRSWRFVPVQEVAICDLIATQPALLIEALMRKDYIPKTADPYPHVILFQGQMYLEDGHHRVMRAILSGRDAVEARVLVL